MEGTATPVAAKIRVGVVGGAIVPHAPQLLNLPDTEDKAQVARVRAAMGTLGERLRALEPDLVIVISNPHGEANITRCVPPFMFYCANDAKGAGRHEGDWRIDGETGYALARMMMDEGFDPAFTLDAALGTSFTIPLDYCGFPREATFLPLMVNVYVPPQPQPRRCFAFGRALARSVERLGRRAVILASGGLSHYPATPRYPTPDLDGDRAIFERLKAGNLHYLMSLDERRLDETGNIELRGPMILAGALARDMVPDIAEFEPSWHHIYAVVGWTRLAEEAFEPLYPAIASRHAELGRALYAIVTDDRARARYVADRAAYAASYQLDAAQRAALVSLDEDELRQGFTINPMLTYQAKLRVGAPLKHRTRIK